ncbi:hypothetical protein K474DRAFT_1581460, partial [Panus rudis PR-1116 ss-1]
PFARYTSVVGVHTSLLTFTALILPKTSLSSLIHSASVSEDLTPRGRLEAITKNPLRTVAWICVGTFMLQAWWSTYTRKWLLESRESLKSDAGTSNVDNATEKKLQRQKWNDDRDKLLALAKACIFTLATSLVYSFVIILFGAPLNSHYLHTLLLSLILALLTVFSPAYTLGAPTLYSNTESFVRRLTWIRIFAELSPRSPIERAILYSSVGAVLGCWVGAIPIGLDWERPWQAWPLTPTYGAIAGYVLGSLWAVSVNGLRHI